MNALVKTKFFNFSQNNSGGSFVLDEAAGITHYVIVEAVDADHANRRAEEIGLYFGGLDDCPCCGDRWSSQWDNTDGYDFPSIYGEPIDTHVTLHAWMPPGKESVVHYLDGRKEWHGVFTKSLPEKVEKVKTPRKSKKVI